MYCPELWVCEIDFTVKAGNGKSFLVKDTKEDAFSCIEFSCFHILHRYNMISLKTFEIRIWQINIAIYSLLRNDLESEFLSSKPEFKSIKRYVFLSLTDSYFLNC